MIYSRISGTGSYLPEKILTNRDLEQIVDTSDAWIRERTGIEERRMAAEGQTTSDLAMRAATAALEAAGVKAGDIDMLIVGTTTPDKIFPSTACLVQEKLGVPAGAMAFDLQAVCSGFMYGLSIADRYIRTGGAKRALVIGAETLTRLINWKDRGTCIIFGDGAGAVVLEASDEPGIYATHMHADGSYAELLHTPWGVSQGYENLVGDAGKCVMKGNEVFKVAVRRLGEAVEEVLESSGFSQDQVDWLIPHQANTRIIQATAKKLGLPPEQVVLTVQKHGNTSAASVPLALDTAVRDGRVKRGQLLLLEAFGGGFTWGSALVRF